MAGRNRDTRTQHAICYRVIPQWSINAPDVDDHVRTLGVLLQVVIPYASHRRCACNVSSPSKSKIMNICF